VKISPSTYDEANTSPGELRLFTALSNETGSPNWLVLHSLEIAQLRHRPQGEADFVILAPGHGILVLEVKAHQHIAYDGHMWTLGDRQEHRGPFKQANDAKWAIKESLKRRGISTDDVPFVHAVWFTSLPKNRIPESVEWSANQVFSIEDFTSNLSEMLSERIDALVEQTNIHFSPDRAPVAQLETIGQALRPRFIARETVENRQKRLDAFLKQALEAQLNRYTIIKNLKAVLLDGLAGTGKTFIAEQFAREANETDEKTLYVCYNRLLARKVKDELIDCDYVEVSTIHALMCKVANLAPKDLENKSNDFWRFELPTLALKAAGALGESEKYTNIIIDEAQDLGTDEYLLFLSEITRDSFSAARKVIAVGDFQHQGLYVDGAEAKTAFLSLNSRFQELALERINCRNTRNVGEFVNVASQLDPEYHQFLRHDTQGDVHILECGSKLDMRNRILNSLTETRGKYQEHQVVLLTNDRGKLEEVLQLPNPKFAELGIPGNSKIRYGTVHEFKGLEAPCVYYITFGTGAEADADLLYVAGTRALGDFHYVYARP
jgi:hypothetical protein